MATLTWGGPRRPPLAPGPLARALLTALAGSPTLGSALIQGLLLPVVVLVSLAVSAGTRTDAALEGPTAQHLATAGG